MAKTRKPNPPQAGTGMLIFGLLLTVIGGGLLIERIAGVEVWDHLWRLWPLLLIIMGVKILVDYYLNGERSRIHTARNLSSKEQP